jgi:hypothetical protein
MWLLVVVLTINMRAYDGRGNREGRKQHVGRSVDDRMERSFRSCGGSGGPDTASVG